MPANLTNLTESGFDLADKYLANTDYNLINNFLTANGQLFYDSVFFGPGTGGLWAWGDNTSQILGLGDNTPRSSPVQVGSLTNWKQIDTGGSHNLAIKTDGTLWAWGQNLRGQLGLGDRTNRYSPVQVGTLTNWKQVAAGAISTSHTHSLAIKTDGTLWSWGLNNPGQLGLGDLVYRSSPVQVGSLTNWRQVGAGVNWSAAIKTDGTLWTWGNNGSGQLGLGDRVNRSSPVQVGTLTNWKQLATGSYHILATKTDGTLWAWGRNLSGELGVNDGYSKSSPVQVGSLTNWAQISAGASHTLAIKTNGTLWAWGRNADGQLGNGQSGGAANLSSPVQIGTLTNWKRVKGGDYHTLAVKTDGTLWSCGRNTYKGQLGLGDVTSRSSPVQVGSLTTWNQVSGGAVFSFAIRS